MTAGKAASQAGHAFLDAFDTATPDQQDAYRKDGGTKIVLSAADERSLCDVFRKAKLAGIPCAMVIEQDHVMPPCFDGSPVPTAVGIGPLERSKLREFTRGLKLMA